MSAFAYDSGSSWSRKDQYRIHKMNPVFADLGMEVILRNFNKTTGAYEGPITLNEVDDVVLIGAQANVVGSGIAITSSRTYALKVCSDDVAASIASSVRGIQSRFLLTVDQTGGSIRALQGQLKLADGVDVTSGIYTANQGYVELMGDHSAKTGSTFSCFNASLEIASAKTLTIDSGGEACGIHVETTGAGTITNNGTCAGILISNASGAPDWPVGIDLTDSCTTGIDIGNTTTGIAITGTATDGILVSGACTDAIEISGDATNAINISSGCTPTVGLLIAGAAATPISITGAFTTGISIAADGTVGMTITSAFTGVTGIAIAGTASTAGLNISGNCTTGITIGAQTTAGITIGATGTGIAITGACSTAAISISGAEAIGLSILTSTPTDGINIAAACANGIAIGGANTTAAISITGAEAVGLLIATSTPTSGISISAACADGIAISGANTTAGINISGAEALGLSINTSTPTDGIAIAAACSTAAVNISGAEAVGISINTSTPTDGILISAACANGVSISGANTTAAVNIAGAEAVGISINTSTPTDGINIAAACANAIAIGGTNTTAGISISGDQVLGVLFHATAAATAAFAVTVPTGITLDKGLDINATSTGVVTSGLTMQGTGTFTTGITLSATAMTTGISISAPTTNAIAISGTSSNSSLWISGAGTSGYNEGSILIAGDQAGTALAYGANTSGAQVVRIIATAQITGGENFHGIYSTLETAGAMADGFIIGHYSRVNLAHVAYENYAIWGRMNVNVAQTGDTGNQYLGVFGSVSFAAGAHALTATGGGYGVLGSASIASGGTLDQPLIAGYFDCNAVDDIAGLTCAVRARMLGYCDYGVDVLIQTNNNVAAIRVAPESSAKVAVGISFEVAAGSGVINHIMKFEDSTNCGVNTSGNVGAAQASDAIIKIDVAGTDYYLAAFVAGSVTGNWSDS